MRKNYLVWFAILAFLIIGCRNDNFNANETRNNQQALKFRVVPRSEIPQIITALQAKTNFAVPLRSISSGLGKTETVFGEINTNYIIESTNGKDEVFYTFPIMPNTVDNISETYNLVVKTDDTETETDKIVVYEPTADWIAKGNNDYQTFSGKVYTYSLDGNIESAVAYLNGNCNPEPCPDCPTQQGPGGGGGGTGGGGTGGGGGNGPTGTGGPVGYPGTGGGTTGGGTTGGDTTGGGVDCHWVCIYDENDQCTKMECIKGETPSFTANRAPSNSCVESGGGVIITTQNDPCTKTKNLLTNTNMQASITQLKDNATSGTGEMGFKATKAGVPTPMIPGGDHNVKFGDKTGFAGGYHNHTKTGIPMLSPPDIDQLLGFARAQGNYGDPTQAFVGMVAPNGMHYIIRFEGTYQDATSFNFMDEDLKKLKDDYRKTQKILLDDSQYFDAASLGLNTKGLEKLFFDTLANMKIDKSKITLQRVDSDGVKTINLNNDGTTTPVPCS